MPERFTSIIDAHVILRRHGKILLLRRAGDVYASGQLCLPSGHLEEGENILQTAIRETREETSIILDHASMRLVLSIHQRNQGRPTAASASSSSQTGGKASRPTASPPKCFGLVWADPQWLPADTAEYTTAILHAVHLGATFALNGWPSAAWPDGRLSVVNAAFG